MFMRKILFACVLLVGISGVSVADEYFPSLYDKCRDGSIDACEKAVRCACWGGIVRDDFGQRVICTTNKKICDNVLVMKGALLYDKGDYIGAKESFDFAISRGGIQAQKAMSVLCSKKPWVCNRPSPLGL